MIKAIVPYSELSVVNIEATNICQLFCAHCGDDKTRKKGFIMPDLFEKVASQCRGKEIRLFMSGEPLLHPQILGLIRIAKKYSQKVVIHTNAYALDEVCVQKIIDSGLDYLSISFDGLTKEEYESIRVGSVFEVVSENIRRFLALNKGRVHTTLQRIIKFGQENKSLESLFPGASSYTIIVRHSWDVKGKVDGCKPKNVYERYCYFPWHYLPVLWNGEVCLCCADLNGKCIIGDANIQSIEHIWNGSKIVGIRDRIIREKPIPEICSGCERYNR